MEVIGVKFIDFEAKNREKVQGVKLFVTDDSVRVDSGVACESFFLSYDLLNRNNLCADDFFVGQHLRILYNKFGRIQYVTVG